MEPIIIPSTGKTKYYDILCEKYLDCAFGNTIEEQEFLLQLKNLISEDNNEIEFEHKVWLLNILVSGVKLKKYGFI